MLKSDQNRACEPRLDTTIHIAHMGYVYRANERVGR